MQGQGGAGVLPRSASALPLALMPRTITVNDDCQRLNPAFSMRWLVFNSNRG
jgi:hypothetical protein